jgi:hypothetical protein
MLSIRLFFFTAFLDSSFRYKRWRDLLEGVIILLPEPAINVVAYKLLVALMNKNINAGLN